MYYRINRYHTVNHIFSNVNISLSKVINQKYNYARNDHYNAYNPVKSFGISLVCNNSRNSCPNQGKYNTKVKHITSGNSPITK